MSTRIRRALGRPSRPVSLALVIGLVLGGCASADGVAVPAPSGDYEAGTVSGLLAGDERFDAILALLERAQVSQGPPGMQEVLGSAADTAERADWEHTLFAPTDEAFAALDQQTIDCMFGAERATESVRLHVLPRLLTSAEFESGQVQTIGGNVAMVVDAQGASYASARVVESDMAATNGLIHAIDGVNVPPACTR